MLNNILHFKDKSAKSQYLFYNWIAKSSQLNLLSRTKLVNITLVMGIGLLFTGFIIIAYQILISPIVYIINLFIGAWLIALVLEPIVKRLVKCGLPKIIAIILTYLVLISALVTLFALILTELYELINDKLNYSSATIKNNINNLVNGFGIESIDFGKVESELANMVDTANSRPFNLVIAVGFGIVQLILLIIISFTLLASKEYNSRHLQQRNRPNLSLLELAPTSLKRYFSFVYRTIEKSFKGYLRGRVEIALLYGVVVGVVMFVAGLDCPVATAFLCFLILIIPVVGAPISLFLPSVIGLLGDNKPVLVVFIALFVIQTLLLNAVLPKWLKCSSESGPVATLFILLVGAQLGGLFGILVAVPLAGAIKKILLVTFRLQNRMEKEHLIKCTEP